MGVLCVCSTCQQKHWPPLFPVVFSKMLYSKVPWKIEAMCPSRPMVGFFTVQKNKDYVPLQCSVWADLLACKPTLRNSSSLSFGFLSTDVNPLHAQHLLDHPALPTLHPRLGKQRNESRMKLMLFTVWECESLLSLIQESQIFCQHLWNYGKLTF